MPDTLTAAQRSERMSRIRSRGNQSTELRLISIFRENHIVGWRRHPRMTGHPDFLFRTLRIAVFVDGCFWHGCTRHGAHPRTNARFWREKIARNQARDRQVNRALRLSGWRVLRIWEHALASAERQRLLARFLRLHLLPLKSPSRTEDAPLSRRRPRLQSTRTKANSKQSLRKPTFETASIG